MYYCKQNQGAEIYFCLLFQFFLFIAPAFSKVRYRGSTFRPFVRSFVRSSVRPSVRPQFASSLGINFISLQQW